MFSVVVGLGHFFVAAVLLVVILMTSMLPVMLLLTLATGGLHGNGRHHEADQPCPRLLLVPHG